MTELDGEIDTVNNNVDTANESVLTTRILANRNRDKLDIYDAQEKVKTYYNHCSVKHSPLTFARIPMVLFNRSTPWTALITRKQHKI